MSSIDPVVYISLVTEGKSPTRLDITERVRAFAYEDEETKADKLTLTLDNFDFSFFEDPSKAVLLRKGAVLEASWGYYGRMSAARRCVVSSLKGGTVLKVEALSKEFVMHRQTKTRSFENMKRSDVARMIAVEQGYTDDRIFIQDTGVVLQSITQASTTDLHLLRDMARREGFEFYVDFDGFHFHERKLGQRPLREFVWYTDRGRGEVLSWDITSDLYKGKVGGVSVKGIDPLNKQRISVDADNKNTAGRDALAPTSELFTGINARDLTLTTVERPIGSSVTMPTTEQNAANAKRSADALYKKSQLSAVELSLECIGDPDLVAKSVVTVSGISIFSGNYYVIGVSHKIGNGYTMTVKLRRNGKNEGAVRTSAAVNSAKPPPGETGADGSNPELVSSIDSRTQEVNWGDSRGRKN